jgi:proline iminopeptidase
MWINKFLIALLSFISFNISAQQEHLIETNDGQIRFITFGEGEPIIIINGGPGLDCSGFETVAQLFSNWGYKAIIFDQRGTGQSSLNKVDSTTLDLRSMIVDVELIRKKLGLQSWHVFGQSWGGIYAAHYAAHMPYRIKSIIFSSSAGVNLDFLSYLNERQMSLLNSKDQAELNKLTAENSSNSMDEKSRKKRAELLANSYFFDDNHASKLAPRLMMVDQKINSLVFNNLIKMKWDVTPKIKNTSLPVLVFQGDHDIIKMETAEKIVSSFPNSKLVKLSNCGHYPWIEKPKEFEIAVKEFKVEVDKFYITNKN